MKNLILVLFAVIIAQIGFTQSNKKIKEVTIESSIQCGMCVNRLNTMFEEYWAVKDVSYNLEAQEITVTYNSKKTNVDEIRQKISATGYDADEVEASIEPYMNLPACCKKGAHLPEE